MTDVVTVETADHARLNLTLSYNWHFDVSADDEDANRIFNVRDFVGDACKAIASRVRGAVAAESFDNFRTCVRTPKSRLVVLTGLFLFCFVLLLRARQVLRQDHSWQRVRSDGGEQGSRSLGVQGQ